MFLLQHRRYQVLKSVQQFGALHMLGPHFEVGHMTDHRYAFFGPALYGDIEYVSATLVAFVEHVLHFSH